MNINSKWSKRKLGLTFLVAFCIALVWRCQIQKQQTKQDKIEELRDYLSSLSESQSRQIVFFAGTYEFTDTNQTTWVLTLKEDETVTLIRKGKERIYYGSWRVFPYDEAWLDFGWCEGENATISFPSKKTDINFGILTKEYIYASNTAYKAKNPHLRLPIKQIK